MSNTLFVLLDGAEDDPHPLLDGKKPIDVAEMPFLESKVKHRYRTTGRGYTHLFLNEFFTGHPPEIPRAVLEAMGLGMDLHDPSRTAYRLSPANICDGMIRWSYTNKDLRDDLIESVKSHMDILDGLDPDIRFFIGGRAILTMRCDDVPDLPAPPVDSPYVDVPGKLGELVRAVMEDLDGFTDYPWGCGKMGHQYPCFDSIRDMVAISNSPTALGICASLGHETILVDELDDRFPVAAESLKHHNVFLHIDEVDEYSHQKDPFKKKRVLEHTDEMMEKYFPDIDNIVYFADHGTSCVTGEHKITDVPVWTDMDLGYDENCIIPLTEVVEAVQRNRR